MGTEVINKEQDKKIRKSGILLHPTSFPGPYGIGDLGDSAYRFIDFLEETDQELWQILPIGPTGYGDSPYQSFSSFAGQPLIISPDKLKDIGLLTDLDLMDKPHWDPCTIDYGPVIEYKLSILKRAYENFLTNESESLEKEYASFCVVHEKWLDNYALFMACKDYHEGNTWVTWDHEIAHPTESAKKKWAKKLLNEIEFYKFIQFMFYKQWAQLRAYANKKNIKIIGDIPIFVAFDSADVWANPELYYLNEEGYPTEVAGVPPDYFSETGQLWGNPLYNWDQHNEDGYDWWIRRIAGALKLVDILRIDHFRGFEAYWAVPYGSDNAINGEWRKGPGNDLLDAFIRVFGKQLPIIAEDLGIITPEVKELRDHYNLPGMKILQFGFETLEDSEFLPHNFIENSVCYTGTHDNDTSIGWYLTANELNKDKLRRYMNTDANDISWDFIRTCLGSVSKWAIVPLQDLLSLDGWARMNTPGVAAGNWKWRYSEDMIHDGVKHRLKSMTEIYAR